MVHAFKKKSLNLTFILFKNFFGQWIFRWFKRMNLRISHMGKRVTIVLDDELIKKLHEIQAKQIKESTGSVSFSEVINETLKKGLRK
jgi:hypothetical protein